mmetsp:Transcript_21934/g.46298  ORF Transcript_21934/g.46298 Transcript_21934/m.46298 type:complete len:84 (+) Transcript_21934:329-580(+)
MNVFLGQRDCFHKAGSAAQQQQHHTIDATHAVNITFQTSYPRFPKFITNESNAASIRTTPNTAPSAAIDEDTMSNPFNTIMYL